jgi:hypothetical protein
MDDPRARLVDPAAGGDVDAVLRALDRYRAVIVVGELSPVAATAAGAAIALAARLFAHVEVRGNAPMAANVWGVAEVAAVLAAVSAIRPTPVAVAEVDITLAVGRAAADLAAGGGAWTVRVAAGFAAVEESEVTAYGHALGLHAAVALAVNEVMKRALAGAGMVAMQVPDHGLCWNLIDYRLTPAPPVTAATENSRPVLFAGCGSVGGSAVAVLSMSPGVRGSAALLDVEEFDPVRNPFRYPALRGGEIGVKTMWAAPLLAAAGWPVSNCQAGVRGWITRQDRPGFDGLVVSTVDEVPARLDVADMLARDVCSIGVAGLALHVQRERLGDGHACPFCEYVAAEPPLTQAHVTAQQLGLAVDRVIALQHNGASLTDTDVAAAAAAGAISRDAAPHLVGRRLGDLIARSYAEVGLGRAPGTGVADTRPEVTVAAPQVSWLAGTLAAAEVAKYLTGLPCLDRRVDVDLTGLPQGFTRRVDPDQTGRCVCASGHRRRWMRRMYPSS